MCSCHEDFSPTKVLSQHLLCHGTPARPTPKRLESPFKFCYFVQTKWGQQRKMLGIQAKCLKNWHVKQTTECRSQFEFSAESWRAKQQLGARSGEGKLHWHNWPVSACRACLSRHKICFILRWPFERLVGRLENVFGLWIVWTENVRKKLVVLSQWKTPKTLFACLLYLLFAIVSTEIVGMSKMQKTLLPNWLAKQD